jgi:hypothetical protein
MVWGITFYSCMPHVLDVGEENNFGRAKCKPHSGYRVLLLLLASDLVDARNPGAGREKFRLNRGFSRRTRLRRDPPLNHSFKRREGRPLP